MAAAVTSSLAEDRPDLSDKTSALAGSSSSATSSMASSTSAVPSATSTRSPDDGLSGGQIAGIVVGCVVGGLLLIGIGLFCCSRRTRITPALARSKVVRNNMFSVNRTILQLLNSTRSSNPRRSPSSSSSSSSSSSLQRRNWNAATPLLITHKAYPVPITKAENNSTTPRTPRTASLAHRARL
ncbi:hypothetical protein KC333_g34 [Hortaea werneckii]|nr:hypothetical protein KC333_g34 [Hortaea werneckii]